MRNALHIAEAQRDKKLKEIESEIARAVQDMEEVPKKFIQADKRVQHRRWPTRQTSANTKKDC
jgi:hypothetical protein